MAREKRDSLAELNAMSKAIREILLNVAEKDLDEAIRSEGEEPEMLAGKGRATIERALTEYWAQTEGSYKEINRQSQGHFRRRDL